MVGSSFCTRLLVADEGELWAVDNFEVCAEGGRVSMTGFAVLLDPLKASFKPRFLRLSTLIGGEVSQCRILEKRYNAAVVMTAKTRNTL